jgi:hypothetical protein
MSSIYLEVDPTGREQNDAATPNQRNLIHSPLLCDPELFLLLLFPHSSSVYHTQTTYIHTYTMIQPIVGKVSNSWLLWCGGLKLTIQLRKRLIADISIG